MADDNWVKRLRGIVGDFIDRIYEDFEPDNEDEYEVTQEQRGKIIDFRLAAKNRKR